MKVVILAGGFGTRLGEETELKPKPMVEIGGKPILWHIMKGYASHGYNEFIICLGYRGYVIKEYFANYFIHQSDVTFDYRNGNQVHVHANKVEPWIVTLVDTGLHTMTGGRIRRIEEYVGGEAFMMTYGDGLADIDLSALVRFHRQGGNPATVTAVHPPGRFGALELGSRGEVVGFIEKPKGRDSWINGGFFVLEPEVFEYIHDDFTRWEKEPLETLASSGNLGAFWHEGFWQPMDTPRDRIELERLWREGQAPWKMWE